MAPDFSKADEDRFAELKDRLEGVSRASDSEASRRIEEFTIIDPMLAEPFSGTLDDVDPNDWIAERKYDGTRILLERFDGDVRLYTRRDVERSDTLPAVAESARTELPDGLILDGEVAFVDDAGRSYFHPIHGSRTDIDEAGLTTVYFVFDVLAIDHQWVTRSGLLERKSHLSDVVPPDHHVLRVVPHETQRFQAFFDRVTGGGEEGIIIKRRTSQYLPGTRSRHWQKVKQFHEADVAVIGYTQGEGARNETFGALVMAEGSQFIGKVGSGFTDADLTRIRESVTHTDSYPIPRSDVGESYVPIEPFVITVKFQEVTDDGYLRAPVFLAVRDDVSVSAVDPISDQISGDPAA